MKKTIIKQTLKEALQDRRWIYAASADLIGAASTLGYLAAGVPGAAGDAADIVYAPMQTALIDRLYGAELEGSQRNIAKVVSMAEELLPGPTDLIPTATLTHLVAAYNRVQRQYQGGNYDTN